MGFGQQLLDETIGITFSEAMKRTVGLSKRPKAYKQYKTAIKQQAKRVTQDSGIKIRYENTAERIAAKHGFKQETLKTLQTMEFLAEFHKMLISKGYKKPYSLDFVDRMLPKECGFVGQAIQDCIIYNPSCIDTLEFRVPIHETAHTMTKRLLGFSTLFKQIGTSIVDKIIPFMNKKEKEICQNDFKRAWDEGYCKHNPIKAKLKAGMIDNRSVKHWKKHEPWKQYFDYAMTTRFEFIAEYFALASRGFKFSPETDSVYKKLHGPEIKEIITEEDLQKLEKLKKQILKKSLSDYGVTVDA